MEDVACVEGVFFAIFGIALALTIGQWQGKKKKHE
jgi:hypothetical protein